MRLWSKFDSVYFRKLEQIFGLNVDKAIYDHLNILKNV